MKCMMIATLLGVLLFASQAFAADDPNHCPYQGKKHFECRDQLVE